jgi:aromatic-L-amino-acid decarboxylase
MWLPLHLHGVDAFRATLDEKLDLAEHVYAELSADPLLDVPMEPALSTVAFRLRAGDTAELMRRVNAEAEVFLSSTMVGDHHTGRICVLNHRTDHDRVDRAVSAIHRHARELS